VILLKKIAVYCGAAAGTNGIYAESARQLGLWMVKNEIGLVYGGGRFGLMGIIAKTIMENGGHVDGIIPQELADRGASYEGISKLQVVENMTVRKQIMMEMADGFIALPGGPGTLEEISEVYSWSLLGDNAKPCVLFNANHYYDSLQNMYDTMTQNGFLSAEARQKLLFSNDLTQIQHFMNTYVPPAIRKY
jgi:uncharacterized protein (TIGR00730 family)